MATRILSLSSSVRRCANSGGVKKVINHIFISLMLRQYPIIAIVRFLV